MDSSEPRHICVLIADERNKFIEPIAEAVQSLGHRVVDKVIDPSAVADATAEHNPDVAIVALHEDTEHALELVARIADESVCPVMAMVEDANPEFIAAAANRGIFAHLDSADAEELRGAIDVTLKRFEEYTRLRAAFGRRALIERAKGILMERHSLDEREAFERMRGEARSSRRELREVVEEVLAAPGP